MTRPRKNGGRPRSSVDSAIVTALKVTDRLGNNAINWMTTDHLGTNRFLQDLPPMGFRDTLTILAAQLLGVVVGCLVGGVLYFLLIFYGIPYLIAALLRSH